MEVAQLNQYEKVLIQRAKAFQVVTKMKTVAGKRLPPSHMVSKIRGSTFHLPLPLQETLKCLPTPDQPIPEHGELYILLRSIPTAKNVVWQDLVDINKVYSALCKLREINPLYHEIQLPADASELELNLSIMEDMLSSDVPPEGPLRYVATEVHDVMTDFEDLACHVDPVDVQDMINRLNEDQLRVFTKVRGSGKYRCDRRC